MSALRPMLAVLACVAAVTACGTVRPDLDPGDANDSPAIVELSPVPEQQDFFFEDRLWARFEAAPESASLTLLDSVGGEVSAQVTSSSDGMLYTLDPDAALVPSSAYIFSIRTGGLASTPLEVDVSFQTSAHGLPINPAAGGLSGTVFQLDVSEAVLVEPASAGAVILSEIESWNLLLGFAEESSFEPGEQPGVHIYAAFSRATDTGWEQDPCSRTASLTFGTDGLHDTGDDAAATWSDPRITLGPRDINFLVGLVEARVKDLRFEGLVHPDLIDMKDFSVQGIFDTRALDIIFETAPEPEDGITCDLLETLGINCLECGGSNPGPYCVQVQSEGIAASRVTMPALRPRNCADVIEHGLSAGECAEQMSVWEPAADGSYALCPEYTPPPR